MNSGRKSGEKDDSRSHESGLGLNDYHIAQLPGKWIPRKPSSKSDVSYVLAQKPEIIIFRGDPYQGAGQVIERELATSPYFQEQYHFLYNKGWLHLFIHKSLCKDLKTCDYIYKLPEKVKN